MSGRRLKAERRKAFGRADFAFHGPLPVLEYSGSTVVTNDASIFGIDPASYDLWSGNGVARKAPGPVTPLPRPGTKARAVRLRGMVGVLQDQWHMAGVWPWLDGQRFIDKPWVLTVSKLNGLFREMYPDPWPAESEMTGLLGMIQRQGREQDRPLATQRNVPPEMENRYRIVDINRATGVATATGLTTEPAPPKAAKRGRVPAFIPTRRLDGRR